MALLPLFLAGCQFQDSSYAWTNQLHADGPCYQANLLDGIDESGTAELHAVFACVNQTGAIDAFRPIDDAFDATTRAGSVGVVLAGWMNGLDASSVSLAGIVDDALAALDDRESIASTLHFAFELVYAAPWADLGTSVPLADPASLDAGLAAPLIRLAGPLATALLDDDYQALAPIQAFARSESLVQLAWTAASVAESTDPTLAGLADAWPTDVADVISRAENTANNRSFGESGNSLRDLITVVVAPATLSAFRAPLSEILEDSDARDAVSAALRDEVAHGRLATLPAQALYLASVDSAGGGLSGGEASALLALIRLLHDTNTSVDCSIDLGLTSVDFSFGNLAVAILETLANTDPDTTESGVSLLGDMLGVPLTDAILSGVADSGVCPAVTAQVVADLHAIDRLNDPASADLLRVLLDLLNALQDHIPAIAEAATVAYDLDVIPAVEEALRDLADAPFIADILDLVPVLLDPTVYHADIFPDGVEPLAFADVWEDARVVLTGDALDQLDPVLSVVIADDNLWAAVHNLGTLLAYPNVELRHALADLSELVADDPTLEAAKELADDLDDPTFLTPALEIIESEPVRSSLLTTTPDTEGPIPFVARLARGDTLDVLLDTLDLLRALLPEDL